MCACDMVLNVMCLKHYKEMHKIFYGLPSNEKDIKEDMIFVEESPYQEYL